VAVVAIAEALFGDITNNKCGFVCQSHQLQSLWLSNRIHQALNIDVGVLDVVSFIQRRLVD
jgi:hypothetical protein